MSNKPHRRHHGDFTWEEVPVLAYKQDGTAPFRDVTRQVLFEDADLGCQLRYFEVAPGGHSTLERHEHVHAVSTDLVPKPNVVHGKRNDAFDKTREIKVARIFLTIIPSIAHRGVHIANVQSLGPRDDALGITGRI